MPPILELLIHYVLHKLHNLLIPTRLPEPTAFVEFQEILSMTNNAFFPYSIKLTVCTIRPLFFCFLIFVLLNIQKDKEFNLELVVQQISNQESPKIQMLRASSSVSLLFKCHQK